MGPVNGFRKVLISLLQRTLKIVKKINQKALVLPLNKIDVIIVWHEGLALC